MTKKQPGSLQSNVLNEISCMCEFFFDILYCLDPLKDFMRRGHTYRLTSGFRQTLKGWEKCCFLKPSEKYRENKGNF